MTMPFPLNPLIGLAAGLLIGWGAWWVGLWFVESYKSEVSGIKCQVSGVKYQVVGLIGLWGAYAGWRAAGWPQGVSALVVTGLLATVTLVDFQVRRIPNGLVLALLGWAAVQALWLGQPTVVDAGLGLLVGGGFFLLLAIIGRGAMGAGDVKLATALGALMGYPLALTGLLWGVLAGGAAALFLLLTRRATRKDTMAYGPYLALGAWVALARMWGLWP